MESGTNNHQLRNLGVAPFLDPYSEGILGVTPAPKCFQEPANNYIAANATCKTVRMYKIVSSHALHLSITVARTM